MDCPGVRWQGKKAGIKLVGRILRLAFLIFFSFLLLFRVWASLSIQKVVRDYNSFLEAAYLSMDSGSMLFVAEAREKKRVDLILGGLRSNNERAEARLLEIKFSSLKPGFSEGRAETKEKWFFRRFDAKSGKINWSGIYSYKVAYRLLRKGFSWKVGNVKILAEEGIRE